MNIQINTSTKKLPTSLLIGGLSVLVISGIASYMMWTYQGKTTLISSAKVESSSLATYVTVSGEVERNNQVVISSAAVGRITDLFVQPGETVKKGDVLAKLDGYTLAEQQLRAVERKLEQTKQLVELAKQKLGTDEKITKSQQEAQPAATNQQSSVSAVQLHQNTVTLIEHALQNANVTVTILEKAESASQITTARLGAQQLQLQSEQLKNIAPAQSVAFLKPALDQVRTNSVLVKSLLEQQQMVMASGQGSTEVLGFLQEQVRTTSDLSVQADQLSEVQQQLLVDQQLQAALAQIHTAQGQQEKVMDTLQGKSVELTDKQTIVQTEQALIDAESEVERAKALLNQQQLVSTVDGVVALVTKKVGDSVATQEQLCVIAASTTNSQIIGYVSASDVTKVKAGSRVTIESKLFEGKTEGTVRYVSLIPKMEPNSNLAQYPFYVDVTTLPEQARSGMAAKIKIEIDKADKLKVVPVEAIFEKDGKRGVYVKKAGSKDQFQFQTVEIGSSNEQRVEVKNLTEGTEVALEKPDEQK